MAASLPFLRSPEEELKQTWQLLHYHHSLLSSSSFLCFSCHHLPSPSPPATAHAQPSTTAPASLSASLAAARMIPTSEPTSAALALVPPSGTCSPSGTLTCAGTAYPTYTCSPPVSSNTAALLTLNDFSAGGDGGAPSECDNSYHANTESVVALSTGWYAGGSRCGKMINIWASNGRKTTAKVVDECDSRNGCDAEHAGQPPCRNNIVDGSQAVWEALGLNQDLGVVPVTWSMA